ncbi:NTP transferase domain-containing protein, partial [bacterium]|nr:NTP transferase domain-containing protein [bacterium]
MEKKKIAFIQSRMGSTRLPGKSMMEICGEPLLFHVIERVRSVDGFDEIVVATSIEDEDKPILEFCEGIGIPCFRGSKEDVLQRFFEAAKEYEPDIILRVCGDNPLISTEIMEEVIMVLEKEEYDFVTGKDL